MFDSMESHIYLLTICSSFLILAIINSLIFYSIVKIEKINVKGVIFAFTSISAILIGLFSAIISSFSDVYIVLFFAFTGGLTGLITSYVRKQEDIINGYFEFFKTVVIFVMIFIMLTLFTAFLSLIIIFIFGVFGDS